MHPFNLENKNSPLWILASDKPIKATDDDYWNSLYSSLRIEGSSCTFYPFESSERILLNDLVIKLIENNKLTNNLTILANEFVEQCKDVANSIIEIEDKNFEEDDLLNFWDCINLLFVVRCISHIIIERLDRNEFLRSFDGLETILVTTLLDVIVKVPVNYNSYILHSECICLLVTLGSTPLFVTEDESLEINEKPRSRSQSTNGWGIESPATVSHSSNVVESKEKFSHPFLLAMLKYDEQKADFLMEKLFINFAEKLTYSKVVGEGIADHLWSTNSWVLSKLFPFWNDVSPIKNIQASGMMSNDPKVIYNTEKSLPNLSLILIAILLHSPASVMQKSISNPYIGSIQNIGNFVHDSEKSETSDFEPDNDDISDSETPKLESSSEIEKAKKSYFDFSFDLLFNFVCSLISNDIVSLFLYDIIYRNPIFQSFLLMSSDIDVLLLEILKTLEKNNNVEEKNHQVYILLIILVIISHDESFADRLSSVILNPVQVQEFFSSRKSKAAVEYRDTFSILDLIIITLSDLILENINNLFNMHMHSNCFATLSNLAQSFSHLHSFSSDRLFLVFRMLKKKRDILKSKTGTNNNIEQKAKSSNPSPSPSPTMNEVDIEDEVDIYSYFIRVILDVLNASICHSLEQNPFLIYEIILHKKIFSDLENEPNFAPFIVNINSVINTFNSEVSKDETLRDLQNEWSADEIIDFIKKSSKNWKSELLKPTMELKFQYEEDMNPQHFFIPFVWSIVYRDSGITFDPSFIKLFSIDS